MYADRKQWPLDSVDVEVSFDRQLTFTDTNMIRKITINGALTEEQKEVLLAIANKCPTHKTLTQPIHIYTIIQ
jgi:putative redox protein